MEQDKITTALNKWLLEYEPITEIAQYEDIHTEELTDTTKNLALQRTGIELIARYMVGKKEQYQYMLLLKSESEDDISRINNMNWLDDFREWIEEQVNTKNFPVIEGKTVTNITSANTLTYEINEDGSISTYSLQMYFDINSLK